MGFVVDLFCGLGGFTAGATEAGIQVDLAVNHWDYAISTHARNHPRTHHSLSSVWELSGPEEAARRFGGDCDLMLAAPECTDHSHAKGGGARDGASRSLPNAVLYWVSRLRPKVLIVENVPPMVRWGPLDEHGHAIKARAGEDFQRWIRQLRGMGYTVDWRVLCAADYGAPTSRRRLFVVARRDGRAPTWPEPTHGPGRALPYIPVADCIDWSIPMCSVFATPEQAKAWGKHHGLAAPKRPLADATMARIMEAVRRMQDGRIRPFLVTTSNGEREGQRPRVRELSAPLHTITSTGSSGGGLMVPIISNLSFGGRVEPADEPMRTLTGRADKAVVAAHLLNLSHGGRLENIAEPARTLTAGPKGGDRALVVAHLDKLYGSALAGQGLDAPAPSITAQGGHLGVAASCLIRYQGTGGQWADLHAPMLTQPTLARFGLVTLEIDGETWTMTDILFRMLRSPELAAASSFSPHYLLGDVSERDKIAGIGNAVPPKLAAAIIAANNPRARGRAAA